MESKVEIAGNGNIKIHIPVALRCHGGQKRIVTMEDGANTPLLLQLARAPAWQRAIDEGVFDNGSALSKSLGIDPSLVSRTLRLTRLSPEMVHRIVTGDYPETLNCTSLRETIPLLWRDQEALVQPKG
ncbi:MAG: hypothetical protein IJS15_12370 [Victivallales bacterium]|nr:hypothetical protein [Victivallales bacterium]